ncbi:hypothetical protein Nocox_07485 [Nonomuraea coxensis DSM 45129]|uniref:50S ribosomal protein L31 n=1 Tax=Nonomuraea coxensis DSM 45129 TaxID=1122611 RepID=A0ABX8TUT1_9ACTN|nr:hypothetical protein Nocox_07485 [Nonomuraea coxensis DSM 45129]
MKTVATWLSGACARTGRGRVLDSAGRVERFNQRYGKK